MSAFRGTGRAEGFDLAVALRRFVPISVLVLLLGASAIVAPGTLSFSALTGFVSDAAPSALDDAVDHAFLGDSAGVEDTANRYFADGGDPGSLIRVIVARAMLLHRLRLAMDDGRSFETALQGQYVRLSPIRRGALERQASRWSSARLGGLLRSLRPAAANVRRDAFIAQPIAMRALWAIASSARAGLS